MTKDEAERVLWIMMSADNGCVVCAGTLAQAFVGAFKEHAELARSIFKKSHDEDLDTFDD